MSEPKKTYTLAGGLSMSGKVRFAFSELQAIGPYYGNVRVVLSNGTTYILDGSQHRDLLTRWS